MLVVGNAHLATHRLQTLLQWCHALGRQAHQPHVQLKLLDIPALYLLLAITITVCTGAPPLAADGVVLATEKKMPSILVDEQSLHKVVKLNDKIGMVYSVRLTS